MLEALKKTVPGFTVMRNLAMRFRGLLRGDDVGKLNGWINDAQNCGIPSIIHFARTLMHDIGRGTERGHLTMEQLTDGRAHQQVKGSRRNRGIMLG